MEYLKIVSFIGDKASISEIYNRLQILHKKVRKLSLTAPQKMKPALGAGF